MRTTRLLLMLGLLTAAFAVAPQAASALGTVTLQSCSPNVCDGSTWVNSDVSVIYNWTDDANVLSVAGDCTGADPNTGILTVSTEGDHQLTCTVTYVDGPASAPPVEVKIDKTPPVPGGVTTTVLPSLTGWFTAPFSVDRTWTDALSGINPSDCETDAPYSGGESGGATVSMDCRDNAGNLERAGELPGEVRQRQAGRRGRHGCPPARPERLVQPRGLVRVSREPGARTRLGHRRLRHGGLPGPLITAPDSPAATVTGGCSDIAGNSDTTTDALPVRRHTADRHRCRARSCARPRRLVHAPGQVRLPGDRRHVGPGLLHQRHLLRPRQRHRLAEGHLQRRGGQRLGDQVGQLQVRRHAAGQGQAVRHPGQQGGGPELGAAERRRELRGHAHARDRRRGAHHRSTAAAPTTSSTPD